MPDRRAVIFVYATTAILVLAGTWFVLTYGSRLPTMDEWDLLADWFATDSTADWLIAHHNEHRYPLTKLLWLGALRATSYNSKPLLFLPFGLLILSAVLLLRTARTLRGRQHPVDAIIPALLLHWGHGFNWLMAYQLGFALVAYAVAGWMWCASRWAADGSRWWATSSLFHAALIVPCGGFGIAFTPAIVLWCLWVAWRCRGLAFVSLLLAVCVIAYSGWVFATRPPLQLTTTGIRPTDNPAAFVAATVGELCVGLGVWPAKESEAVRVALGVAVLLMYGGAIVRIWRTRRNPASVAAAAVLLGTFLTAAAMAFARGIGFTERMADASAMGLATAWVIVTANMTGRAWLAALASVVVAIGLFMANVSESRGYARALSQSTYRVNRDIRAGVYPMILVSRYGHSQSVLVGGRFAIALQRLKTHGIHPYTLIPDDPPLVAVPLPAGALPLGFLEEHTLPDPPRGAIALRLRVTSDPIPQRDVVAFHWTDADTGAEQYDEATVPLVGGPLDIVYALHGRPTQLRLVVGKAITRLRVEGAQLLLPQR